MPTPPASTYFSTSCGVLRIRITDDGIGGVGDAPVGNGMTGLANRVAAFDGTLVIESPPGGGTTLLIRIPVPS